MYNLKEMVKRECVKDYVFIFVIAVSLIVGQLFFPADWTAAMAEESLLNVVGDISWIICKGSFIISAVAAIIGLMYAMGKKIFSI